MRALHVLIVGLQVRREMRVHSVGRSHFRSAANSFSWLGASGAKFFETVLDPKGRQVMDAVSASRRHCHMHLFVEIKVGKLYRPAV